jgi:hypothetical protein
MNFSLVDGAGLLLAMAEFGIVLILPGAFLAYASGSLGFRESSGQTKLLLAVTSGLAVLPALDSLTTRFASLNAALVLNLVLAALALVLAARKRWHLTITRVSLALLGTWLAILTAEWIDFDVGGSLYQPFIAIDMVKHAATTQAILDTGAPPLDPFFFRPERVSYYYFFYTIAALAQRLSGGLIDARAAVGGLAFWTGVGLYGLARLVMTQTGLMSPGSERRTRIVVLALLAAGGLDIVFVLRLGLVQHDWLPDPSAWNDAVAGWFEALIWVPHHVTGLIASVVGFVALANAMNDATRAGTARAIAMAGLCFASALGLSVWLTAGAVSTCIVWLTLLLIERRWRCAAILASGGIVAILIAAPAILDLYSGRSGPFPIVFSVRIFSNLEAILPGEPLRSILRLAVLPLNCVAQFGVLSLGTFLFWQTNSRRTVHRNELARVLTLAAIVGLLLGTFLKSTLFENNDLGWRVWMFPQFAGLVWTSTVLLRRWDAAPRLRAMAFWRLFPAIPLCLLVLGYCTTLYAFVSLRAFVEMPLEPKSRLFVAAPASDRELRMAYRWADDHLPLSIVLQHNPRPDRRAVSFGMYSRHPVGVSDGYGELFGAREAPVDERLRKLYPLFMTTLSDADVAARARSEGIDALVVTEGDPVWADRSSWVWRNRPLYESARVRILAVATLGPQLIGSVR